MAGRAAARDDSYWEGTPIPTQTLDTILETIDGIPENMCGRPQPEFLYELSRETSGRIVEIGTCAGKSTIALAYGQHVSGGQPITTVDILTHPQLAANLERAGVTDMVRCIVQPSADYAKSWTDPIGLLWIDGDHRYRGVRSDIRSWAKFVRVGGLMAFHDYPSPGGKLSGDVGRAIYKDVLSQPDCWKVRADRVAGSILVVERLNAPLRTRWW